MLVAFILGFIFGIVRFGKNNKSMGLILGLLFGVIASLLAGLINYLLPNNLNFQLSLNFDFKSLFTLVLLFAIFSIVMSVPDIANMLDNIGN